MHAGADADRAKHVELSGSRGRDFGGDVFRTLGSSFGAAVFGSLFANFLASRLPDALRASPGVNPAVTHTPRALHALPAAQIQPIVHAYAQSLEKVFLWAIPVALAGFLLALALKEVPLRGSARASAGDLGDGFGMPAEQSSERCLERAIAVILRERGREHAPHILAQSRDEPHDRAGLGRDPDPAVRIRARRRGHRRDCALVPAPAAVLEPTFEQLAGQGMAARSNGSLTLTPAGQTEPGAHKGNAGVARRTTRGLETEPRQQQIDRALDHIARRMLNDDEPTSARHNSSPRRRPQADNDGYTTSGEITRCAK